VHGCVLDEPLAGARREPGCAAAAGLAQDPEANDAYRCMRSNCGRECGLPVCRVDPAAVLIQNARCDGCFAGSCCTQLNRCYESRACKLMIECISRSCGKQLGEGLVADATRTPRPASSELDAADVCGDSGPPGDFTGRECVRACLCEFRDNDQGLPPEDPEDRPFTLAQRVYQCGASASCGPLCLDGLDGADAP
jgi:hypothetical protein